MTHAFVDTSAFLALLVRSDRSHSDARRGFDRLRAARAILVTTSYVLLETCALLQRRIGMEALADFRREFVPCLEVVWVDADLHERGLDIVVERGTRDLSLVDAVSFEVMRERGLGAAFAYDRHFEDEGFERVRGGGS